MDHTAKDIGGRARDFSQKEMKKTAIAKINKDKPLLIIGGPTCTDGGTIMDLNWDKMGEDTVSERKAL